jgi:hypothetical protein
LIDAPLTFLRKPRLLGGGRQTPPSRDDLDRQTQMSGACNY